MFNWLTKSPSQPKTLGQRGEEFAQDLYRQKGFTILAANEFNKKGKRLGEIDFIAGGSGQIIFVEVKTRSAGGSKFGSGAEAVNGAKQVRLLRAVKVYLLSHPEYQALQPSIDVCVLEYRELDKPQFYATIVANGVEDWN